MGRSSVVAALIAAILAACSYSQPVPLDSSPPPELRDDPPSTGSVGSAPQQAGQVGCSREAAAQVVRVEHTLQASNDPCVVFWRSIEVRQHPERAVYLECNGLKAYPDPQPPGHPISLADCDHQLRGRQARMGVAVTGMTETEKATYRATWGK
jgi:hypothetical protein